MGKYFLLGYSIVLFAITTLIMVMLYPYLDCTENIIIYISFALAGYVGTYIAFKGFKSINL